MLKKRIVSLCVALLIVLVSVPSVVFGAITDPIELNVVDVAISDRHALALDIDGTVWGWGECKGSMLTSTKITKAELPGRAVSIAVGQDMSVAVLEDGSVYAWGEGVRLANYGGFYSPTQITEISNAVSVSAFGYCVLVQCDDGSVWGWGGTGSMLGHTGTKIDVPTKVAIDEEVVSAFCFDNFAYYVLADGTTLAGGVTIYNVLATDPSYTGTDILKPVVLQNIKYITSVRYTVMATTESGDLYGWGRNNYGQLANGTTSSVDSPQLIATGVKEAGLFGHASCIVKEDGTVWTAGSNATGALGIGSSNDNLVRSSFVQVETLSEATGVRCGHRIGMVQTPEGWWAWGQAYQGLLSIIGQPGAAARVPILAFINTVQETEQYTVVVTESWADASQPDVITPYTAEGGDPLTIPFTTPAGYTASVECDDPFTVDYAAGTIGVGSVTKDMDIRITYTPIEMQEGHNVTVIVRYRDGAFPDDVYTYSVPDGAAFYEPYDVREGYEFRSYGLFSFSYRVDPTEQTVYISEVYQDYTVLLQYEPIFYNVTVTTVYNDGALPDNTDTYSVRHGEAFDTTFDMLDGYTIDAIESNGVGVMVDGWDKTVDILRVTGNITITIYLKEK